jgi:MarR family transcriptional regulator for hemolysin
MNLWGGAVSIRSLREDYFETMLRARKGYSRVMEPICQQWDLTRNELDILLFLYNNPDFDRASDVAARRGMAKSHVSLSVATLESKGLLLRRPDPEDRRAVHLQLLGEAEDIARQGREAQIAFFTKIYAGLTEEEIAVWIRAAEKVSANIARLD